MTVRFHQELEQLQIDVLEMGNLARTMLSESIDALVNQDTDLAEEIIAKKYELHKMDFTIEERTLHLMNLFQPMATDMRIVACILKLITYLARIGQYGKDNASIAIELAKEPHVKKLVSLPYMRDLVCGMIDDALKAFETKDIAPIAKIAERDDTIDELYYSIFRECLTYMMEDQKTITRCVNYIMVARHLERCGDHACKMAEKIHYMVTGEHIEIK